MGMALEEFKKDEAKFDLTPMIDCVFLLLIFFMLATRFKQVERKLDCFLPTEEGQMAIPKKTEKPEELSIFIRDNRDLRRSSDFATRSTRNATFFMGSRQANPVTDPMAMYDRLKQLSVNPEQEVLIALDNEELHQDFKVPFFNVVKVIDVCKKAGITKIKFQAPAQPLP